MGGASFFEMFDSKIINCQGKIYGMAFMTLKSRSVGHREVTVLGKMLSKLIVSKDGCFFQSIHTYTDFQVKVALGIKVIVNDVVF